MASTDRDDIGRSSLVSSSDRSARPLRASLATRPGVERAATAQEVPTRSRITLAEQSTRSKDDGLTTGAAAEKRGRPRSLLGFLSVKEPSAVALKEFAEQQRRLAAVKGAKSSSMSTVSQQRLPASVPKVNSKWDGMPNIAHEKGRDGWKKSMDASSVLSRRPKPDLPALSTINSNTTSQRPSGDKHRGTSRHSGSRHSSSKTSAESSRRPHSHRSASDRSERQTGAMHESEREEPASKHSSSSSSTQPSSNSSRPGLSLPQAQEHRRSGGAELRAFADDQNTAYAMTEARIAKQLREANVPSDNIATSAEEAVYRTLSTGKTPLYRSAEIVPQWPLPASPFDFVLQTPEDEEPPQTPPIPHRSARRPLSGVEDFGDSSADSPNASPSTPTMPIPTFDESIAAFQFDLDSYQKPRSTTTYNRPFSPTRTFSPQGRASLRSPSSQPGRPITKETELPTIPESDTASILTDAPAPDSPARHTHPPSPPSPVSGATTARPSYDARDSMAESRASSEMSAQWYAAPKDRLQLGGFMKHQRSDAPWPAPALEDEGYVLEAGSESPAAAHDAATVMVPVRTSSASGSAAAAEREAARRRAKGKRVLKR